METEHGFLVRLEPGADGIRLEVHDSRDPRQLLSEPTDPDPSAESGRGLVIVDALSTL